jgi:phosphatidylserine decarboxylase
MPFDNSMKPPGALARLGRQEQLNFLLTNRVPRALLTHAVGRISRSENPLLRGVSMALWRRFAELDLSDATRTDFRSVHDCFTRALKPGARPLDTDPTVLTSPCDAVVGACGAVRGTQVFQAKGAPYLLQELLHRLAHVCDAVCQPARYPWQLAHLFGDGGDELVGGHANLGRDVLKEVRHRAAAGFNEITHAVVHILQDELVGVAKGQPNF